MKKSVTKKTWNVPIIVFSIYTLFIIVLYVWLAYLSLSPKILGTDMNAFAKTRNTVQKTLSASRGNIYDMDGNKLAHNVSSYTVIAYLDGNKTNNYVKDVKKTAEALASVLGGEVNDYQTLIENGKKKNKYQIELGKNGKGITELKKEEIEALDLKGIDFIESKKRFYPNGRFASYIIGYAKEKEVSIYNEDTESEESKIEITGELGIESQYNDLLRGQDGYLEYQQDRYGYKISGTKVIEEKAQDGYDIYLTIDSGIQRFIEAAIESAASKYEPEWLQINVMDAKTGAILASGSSPTFDPNLRDIENYESPLVTYTFEPGSTMKTYTYMCAMDNGVYDGSKTFKSGSVKIGDDTIKDWNKYGWGTITFDKGYEYSSNVGITYLLKDYLSAKQLKECFIKYGFGKKTGIELSREQSGKVSFNYSVEVANAGFGQGITTTAVQHLKAASIIANNGKMVTPYVVSKIVNPSDGKIQYEAETKLSGRIVKESTITQIKELMYNTIHGTDAGTAAKAYNIEGIDMIGKTGTAQIYNEKGGGYLKGYNDYIYSFLGMYPKSNPEIIIYSAMKKPKKGTNTGLVEATKDVIKSIAKYKKFYVNTKEDTQDKSYEIKSFINKNTEEVRKILNEQKLDVIILGNGSKIVNQYPSSKTTILSGDKVFLLTNDDEYKMPSLKGYSQVEVKALARLLNMKVKIEGTGRVDSQSIKEGTKIDTKKTLKVNLKEET